MDIEGCSSVKTTSDAVLENQLEEPAEGDGGRVPAGEDEIEGDVLEELVGVGGVLLLHEPGQQVVVLLLVFPELQLASVDDAGEVVVDAGEAAGEADLQAQEKKDQLCQVMSGR